MGKLVFWALGGTLYRALGEHNREKAMVSKCPERQGNLVGSLVREGNDREANVRGDSRDVV